MSGSNCALVMALAGQLALGLGARRRVCVMIGLGALGLFVVLVGPDPSVLRAAVMGVVAALAVLSGRGPVSLAALSTAMCVLLVIDPGLGPEFGFALSVCATAGIVVTARPLTRVLEHVMPTVLAIVLTLPDCGLSYTHSLRPQPPNARGPCRGHTSALLHVSCPQ